MFFEEGLYAFNKPAGWTSFDVVNWVKKRSAAKKVGHAGTLDPLATGLLLVAVGRQNTKKIEDLVNGEKEYVFEITFGIETDTYDSEGKIILNNPDFSLTKTQIQDLLKGFIGEQEQIPPMFSALKKNGRKLYELARQGLEVERSPRKIKISELELLGYNQPKAQIRVVCSKGTYIRSLCYDIGRKLGIGAYMSGLVRTRIGSYQLDEQAIKPGQEVEKDTICA